MIKHIIEAGAAVVALGTGVYAYKRKKGMPAPPVAPVVKPVLPPAPQGPPASSNPITQLIASGQALLPVSLGGGVTSTLSDTGMDITTGGDIGGLTDTNTEVTSTGSLGDTTAPDDMSTLDDLAAALTG